jgi:hypothetical protein
MAVAANRKTCPIADPAMETIFGCATNFRNNC